jgi:hypothetical protein
MRFWFAFLFTVVAACGQAADPPEAVISNRDIRVKLYLPDVDNGFYKGARFDWSGMIGSVDLGSHGFYGPWFARVDPEVRDVGYKDSDIIVSANTGAVGPAEEFQTPQGFSTAKPGETFVKIGVGALEKTADDQYAFSKVFKIVDHGKWTSKRTPTSVEITQELADTSSGYGYTYTKTIRVAADKPQLILEHRLKNTGKQAIQSLLYNHNFTVFDGAPTGDISVAVPYEIKSTRAPDPKFATISGKQFSYAKTLESQERAAAGLQGFGTDSSDYDFRIENHKTQTGIRIQGDRPLQNATVWSIRSVVAVEPFIEVKADPGKEFTWTYTYTFYTLGK